MEEYDQFVQLSLYKLMKRDEDKQEHRRHASPSSLIRFYGRPVLPPLLSEKQREEMQRHRNEAQKAAVPKKFTDDPRMAYVQTILQSIQLRKTATLEELLQESDIKTESSHQHNNSSGSVSHSDVFVRSEESLSPTPTGKLKTGISLPPMTSTTNSAFFASNVTPQQSYLEGRLTNQHDSHNVSQPCSCNAASHQSLSSGYVTYENVENTADISGGIEGESFSPSEKVYTVDGFFLHTTSNTIAKMPDIISHPPIDGDELERSGLMSSFCGNLMGVGGICDTSFQVDSVILDHIQAEKSHNSMEHEEEISFNAILDSAKDGNKESVPVSEKSDFSDNPESSQTLSTPHCPTTELHVQQNPGEAEPVDGQVDEVETKTSEEPFPLSLQALLKKSQEYRRRQRMLRNQAKNAKIQERTQEQPRARAEEQSLSDKENDEFLYKGAVTAAGKNTKERRGIFVPSVETLTQKSSENEEVNESEVSYKKTDLQTESTCVTEGNIKPLIVEEETILKNNKLNSFQEVILKPKQRIGAFIQQQPTSTETYLAQDAFYETTLSTGMGKNRTFPSPNFCRSPIHCKSKGIREEEAVELAETTEGKLISPDVTEDKCEEVSLRNENTKSSHRSLPSSVPVMVDGDVTSVLTKSSLHIDQLESNLSSLKMLISDLESTVKENLDNHCQTDSNMQSELSFESIRQSEEIKSDHSAQLGPNDYLDCWEEKQEECREWLRRHSLINFENINGHLGPESNIRNIDVPFTDQEREAGMVKLSEIRLDRISATQREKEKGMYKEGLAQSFLQSESCKRQQLPVKSVLSVAQQLRIPNIFRNLPSDNRVSCHLPGLSDASKHPVERQSEITVEGQSSMPVPSFNQSYDVDTPSGLWLLEGMGSRSELGSQSHLGQEKHLTPNSEGEDQTGKLRVKRRLIMHMKEETQERNDVSRRVSPIVRPNSTTPRASVHWYEGHGNQREKQEKLKQAHAAQLRALQNEHRKQEEKLLQALAVRYSLLHNLSFPCSMSGSHLGETSTFSTLSTLSQPLSPLSQHYRPLLSAAVKGFLTRRLLRTERVIQLVRTIRDTQQFLQALQQQSIIKGQFCSRQDVFLQERVTLQLRAARYEVYDIFFNLSATERMQLISWDRERVRERELRRKNGHTDPPSGKSSLSAATQKSLERKRGMMIQKKTARGNRGVVMRTGPKSGRSAEKLQEVIRGQFRANPRSPQERMLL